MKWGDACEKLTPQMGDYFLKNHMFSMIEMGDCDIMLDVE